MVLTSENILLIGSILLLLSILAGKRAYQYGVPVLLLFVAIGLLAGQDGILGIRFDDSHVTQFIGIVSLNFILFSGGLDTHWHSVRPILKQGLVLSTFGVFFTALTLGSFVYFISDFTLYESLLLGSIVSSTDAAAVFSILRSRNIALKYNLRPTLELESGSNDPMAYVLTISFLTLVTHPEMSFISVIPLFLGQMTIGALAGFAFGWASKYVINHIHLSLKGLYPALVITLMFITFSATDLIGGNGFLAIYICGVYLGNQSLVQKSDILQMFDGIAWLMQIVLFLTLGLLVTPSNIIPYIGFGLIISLFLIVVARPVAVFVSLLPFRLELNRKLYISWVGLRGAVPIVLATYPLIAGIEKAYPIFNIVFFISVTSVLLQGTTLSIFAMWLKVNRKEEEKVITQLDKIISNTPKPFLQEFFVQNNELCIGKKVVNIGFPSDAVVAMIQRNSQYLIPDPNTVLEKEDVIYVLSDNLEGFEAAHVQMQSKLVEQKIEEKEA
ncbi:MAG: potassium/proton antiporter [Chitinophagales bacterium]|nr:potassium/proton antiporter [Chitinophagales bacterium]